MQQRIPRELLQEIQARTSLVEIIGQYVSLQKRGRSYVGLCPFHTEKSPSFHVDEARRMFYCFGCQAGGDVFAFLTQLENRPFPEVVKDLAGRVGVVLPERPMTLDEKKSMDEREEILFLYEVAASFYERQLMDPKGAPAQAYLQKRHLPHELVTRFRLGFAPDGWRNLADYLRAQHHNLYLAEKAGLIAPRGTERGLGDRQQSDSFYDRFRNRVMFPIRDAQGRVIAFGGRILEQGEPKYLNSPEHPLFNKSSALYGLDAARRSIGQEDGVLVVEGYFDCLGLHAAGITHVVATCGTSLTKLHLKALRRYTRNVYLLYDGDRAGIAASERSLPLFLEEDLWPYFIGLPPGKDPDEVVIAEGTEAFKGRIRRAIPLLDQLVLSRSAAALSDAGAREEALGQLSGVLLKLKPEKLDFYINFIAQHFGMQPVLVGEAIAAAREKSRPGLELSPASLRPPPPRPVAVDLPAGEEVLVHWLLRTPEDILAPVMEAEVVEFMLHPGLKQVVQGFVDAGSQGHLPDVQALLTDVPDEALRAKLMQLLFKELLIAEAERERACLQVILGIKERALKQFSARLTGEVNQLSRSEPDNPVLAQKSTELMQIKRELRALQTRISGRAG